MGREKIRNKKVLLVSNAAVLGEEVVQQGVNLSRRMDASLEILHLLPTVDAPAAAQGFEELAVRLDLVSVVAYRQLVGEGDFSPEVLAYAKGRRNLLCVILCATDVDEDGGQGRYQRRLKEAAKLLSCPVVLYTDSPAICENCSL